MIDNEEMQRRAKACEMVADSVRSVYAGMPSSKGFVPKTISASRLVSRRAVVIAKDLIDAHHLHEQNALAPFDGSYWGFWGDMASTRVLEGPEVNVDGAEFHVTADIGNGWKVSAHPDGVKVVDVDGHQYAVLTEQKNFDVVTHEKRVLALRQGALYLAMMQAKVKETGGYLFNEDPNYNRPAKPFGWHGDIKAAGVVRSICSPRPPGEAYPQPFSDEDLSSFLSEMTLKAEHIATAVDTKDLDYARKWDSEHPKEFGGEAGTPELKQAIEIITEYKQIDAAIKELEQRKKELRPNLEALAEANNGRFETEGYTIKVIEAKSPDKVDKKAMERDGVFGKYITAGGTHTRLVVNLPGATEE